MEAAEEAAEVPAVTTTAIVAAGRESRAPARALVCALHGRVSIEEARAVKGGKYMCPRQGCGRWLGRGEGGTSLAAVGPIVPVQPAVGWEEPFRRLELAVRLEMGAAQLSQLAPLAEPPSQISPADLYRISTAHRQAKWLIANLAALPLGRAEEAVKAFEKKAAKALGIPRLIDERKTLAAVVEDLEGTAEDVRGKVQELNAQAGRLAARITQLTEEELHLDEQLAVVSRTTGLSRSQVLDQLRAFERTRAGADRLSNLAGSLNLECWRSQSHLDILKTKIEATQKELRALQGMKDAALDELARKLTPSQAQALWCCVTFNSTGPRLW